MVTSTKNGKYSLKEIFNKVADFYDAMVEEEWKMIWKIIDLERCRSFVWLMNHDRLLTNFRKSKKGLGNTGCKLYGNVCETTIHALRDCPKIMQM